MILCQDRNEFMHQSLRSLFIVLLIFCSANLLSAVDPPVGKWDAKWIWRPDSRDDYNDWMLARKRININGSIKSARIFITADTKYQLYINGKFASDGPVKSFPHHFRYDSVDISPFLSSGENIICVRVHHWGRDTAQSIAVQPGLLVQIEWIDSSGSHKVGTDKTWRVILDPAHNRRSPIVSAHLGFEEQYDARREYPIWDKKDFDDSSWSEAKEIVSAEKGGWKDLQVREIPQLIRDPFMATRLIKSKLVRPPRIMSTLNLGHCQGIAKKADNRNFYRFLLVAWINSTEEQEALVFRPSAAFRFGIYRFPGKQINVKRELNDLEQVLVKLKKGRNPLIIMLDGPSEVEEFQFTMDAEKPISLQNPYGGGEWGIAGPFEKNDPIWKKIRGKVVFKQLNPFKDKFRELKTREIISNNIHALTCFQQSIKSIKIRNPEPMFQDNEKATVIPAGEEDLELLIDLGKEYNAHLGIELDAPAGVIVDVMIFERIHEGAPQRTWKNKSTFRYVTREGLQKYITMRHFGGRYMSLTIRNRTKPIRIKRIFGEFVHYPFKDRGKFISSDKQLNKIWEICRQTMLACSEDTFVDCPLYEQSLWLGDARNEALVSYYMFGDSQLVRRNCIIGAESTELYDLAAMRAPTRWGRIIPAWSFLWLRTCWENYMYNGDKDTLVQLFYPAIKRMLNNCIEKYIDEDTGLFSIQAWQFFDWIKLDNNHKRVIHNNTFLVDCLRLGAKVAKIAGDTESAKKYESFAKKLVEKINLHFWDDKRQAYIDSIHNDGKKSTSVSRQFNTLVLLHDVVPEYKREQVEKIAYGKITDNVVQFGSPFANLYLLELLGETGYVNEMLDVIRDKWSSMMDDQTTTFWESFAEGNLGGKKYPTRSYCHAWSAGPAYTFSRYVMGVRIDEPGGKKVTIVPRVDCLDHVAGVVPLAQGEIDISWKIKKDGQAELYINIKGPITAEFLFY